MCTSSLPPRKHCQFWIDGYGIVGIQNHDILVGVISAREANAPIQRAQRITEWFDGENNVKLYAMAFTRPQPNWTPKRDFEEKCYTAHSTTSIKTTLNIFWKSSVYPSPTVSKIFAKGHWSCCSCLVTQNLTRAGYNFVLTFICDPFV